MKKLALREIFKDVIKPIGVGALAVVTLGSWNKTVKAVQGQELKENLEDIAVSAGSFVVVSALAVVGVLYARKKFK